MGRPRQYDWRVVHDGYKNTYSFTKDGKHIILARLRPQQVHEDQLAMGNKKTESLFVTHGEVEEILCNSIHILFLLVIEAKRPNEVLSLPPQIEKLLVDFADVLPEELPPGLPLIRGIEHLIDILPGAALPNRPASRCSPEEA